MNRCTTWLEGCRVKTEADRGVAWQSLPCIFWPGD